MCPKFYWWFLVTLLWFQQLEATVDMLVTVPPKVHQGIDNNHLKSPVDHVPFWTENSGNSMDSKFRTSFTPNICKYHLVVFILYPLVI